MISAIRTHSNNRLLLHFLQREFSIISGATKCNTQRVLDVVEENSNVHICIYEPIHKLFRISYSRNNNTIVVHEMLLILEQQQLYSVLPFSIGHLPEQKNFCILLIICS